MSICIVGHLDDLASVYLGWLAERAELPVVRLAESEFGSRWTILGRGSRHQAIRIDGVERSIESLGGFFVRFHPEPALPPDIRMDPREARLYISERRAAIEHLLDEVDAPVINRPRAGRSNGSKPFQMSRLARHGFRVPGWRVTNDPGEARAFVEACGGEAIFKSASGLRSRVRRVDDHLIACLERGTNPVLLQQYVPGRDVRLHLAGGRPFATEIVAQGVDYRFDDGEKSYRETTAPPSIVERCVAAAEEEELALSGFDFRVTDSGEWHCLEVNPVPSFLPYEMQTGQAIGRRILEMLQARGALTA